MAAEMINPISVFASSLLPEEGILNLWLLAPRPVNTDPIRCFRATLSQASPTDKTASLLRSSELRLVGPAAVEDLLCVMGGSSN